MWGELEFCKVCGYSFYTCYRCFACQPTIKNFVIQDAEQRATFIALYDGLKSLGTPDDIFGMSVS